MDKINVTITESRSLNFEGEIVEVLEEDRSVTIYFEVKVDGKLEPCELTVTRPVQEMARAQQPA